MKTLATTTDDFDLEKLPTKSLPAEVTVNSGPDAIAALDGLRAIAALLVFSFHFYIQVGFHLEPTTTQQLGRIDTLGTFGETGVHLFFVLSGFLLFLPYARMLLGLQKSPSTRKFYIRRALRILPAYWLALFLFSGLGLETFAAGKAPLDFGLHVFMLKNLDVDTLMSINTVFWTMAIEVQFYLLLPLIAAGLRRLTRQGQSLRRLVYVLPVMWLLSLVYGMLEYFCRLNWLPGAQNVTSLIVFSYLGVFASGAAVALLYEAVKANRLGGWHTGRSNRPATWAGVAGVGWLLLYIGLDFWHKLDHNDFRVLSAVNQWWLATGYALVLVGVLLGFSKGQHWLSHPFLRFIGLISYSFYIWHAEFVKLTIVGFSSFGLDWLTLVGGFGGSLVISIVVATLFYRLIERPFIRSRHAQH